ncbi:MAG: tRNA 2-selenouridine(34) synthase MnmH [Peptococcaceae bacterium]
MQTAVSNDFEKIVLQEIPLIDVRAPLEFTKGAFINAVNLPLMNDEERHLVGICYKEEGSEAAVRLGHQLVAGEIRQQRIAAWTAHLNQYPASMLYCFRGGLRSQLSQKWISEAGRDIPRLAGGYKAFRNYLLAALSPAVQNSTPVLLSGYTGSGKTLLLQELGNAIDLEGIANYRGSSFGRYLTPQPTQLTFENNLAYALIQHKHQAYRYLLLEDEGANIGKCRLPKALAEFFSGGYLVVIEQPFTERVKITFREYVTGSQAAYLKAFGREQGLSAWSSYIRDSINRIQRRLGGELHKRVLNSFELSFQHQSKHGETSLHRDWITLLLKEYYDPMYSYQLRKAKGEILFTGDAREVLGYLQTLENAKL